MISTQLCDFFTQKLKQFLNFIYFYQMDQFIIFHLKKEFCELIYAIGFYTTLKIKRHFTNSPRIPNSYAMILFI